MKVACPNCGRRMQGLKKLVHEEKSGAWYRVFRCSKYEIDRSTGRVRCPNQHIHLEGAK